MRRRSLIVPILLLAGALLAWRQLRARSAHAPIGASAEPAPVALLELPFRFLSSPWTLVDAPPERPQLTLRYTCGEQMELDRVDAQETPTQVFVTVLMRVRAAAEAASGVREEREATVALSAPLGTRALVHAPVDLDPPSTGPNDPPLYS
jgi:hypothetical protein